MHPGLSLVAMLVGSVLSAFGLTRRLLAEGEPVLVSGLTVLLSFSGLLFLANWNLSGWLAWAPLLVLALPAAARVESPPRSWKIFLGGTTTLIAGYSLYAQQRFVDGDSWIHDTLIASYQEGIFPPHNPFFPELAMHGHYGRDLLIAALTPRLGDPLLTMAWMVPLLQVGSFLTLFGLVPRFGGTRWQGAGLAVFIFFGVDVGFRVGWMDSWDGNHPVVNAFLVLCLYLMFRLFSEVPSRTTPLLIVVTGVVLGLDQIVYETYFGLLLLTGLAMGLTLFRSPRNLVLMVLVAGLALALACNEGGTLTEMVHRQTAIAQDTSLQAENQQVSMHFPKARLFQVAVTEAGYQRTSAAFKTRLFIGWANPPSGNGYMSIFDRRFLSTHWLPLFLSPFTLLVLGRSGHRVGLALWIFGACSYLVPGLVDFGEVWEWEYFRWEMAAGVGFAGALGLTLALVGEDLRGDPGLAVRSEPGRVLLSLGRPLLKTLVCLTILVAALAAGEKILGDTLIDLQQHPFHYRLPFDRWRVAQSEFGLQPVDVEAMAWLRGRSSGGQRLLTNLGSELPEGIWPDVEIATRTLTLPAGHALPSRSEATHAHPPYQWNALRRAFWADGRAEMLTGRVDWLYLDPTRLSPEVATRLAASPVLEAGPDFRDAAGGRRQIYRVSNLQNLSAGPSQHVEMTVLERPDSVSLRVAHAYALRVRLHNSSSGSAELGHLSSRVLSGSGEDFGETTLTVNPPSKSLAANETLELSVPFVTPLDEGDYQLELSLSGAEGAAAVRSQPLRVDFLQRIAALKTRVDLPDAFISRHFSKLRVGLSGPPLKSRTELEINFRLKPEGGAEYLWELDRISQPLDLDLSLGKEQIVELPFLAPAPGSYALEIEVLEKESRRRIGLLHPSVRLHVIPSEPE